MDVGWQGMSGALEAKLGVGNPVASWPSQELMISRARGLEGAASTFNLAPYAQQGNAAGSAPHLVTGLPLEHPAPSSAALSAGNPQVTRGSGLSIDPSKLRRLNRVV